MKNKILVIVFLYTTLYTNSQVNTNDFGRIIINTHVIDDVGIPNEAKSYLVTKLDQITSNNGLGGNQINPRFIITAKVNIGTKDIIAGPPQMIAQNIELSLFIGDAFTNTIFSNVVLELKGVGTNENKATIDALKRLKSKNKMIKLFLEEAKNKIINYYSTQCDFIIKDAQTLVKQEKYDEAIYQLALVPEVCQECYFKCLDTLAHIYQQKIDADCKIKFNEAKVTWSATQNPAGAEKSGEILSTINPMASCQTGVSTFIKSIEAKLKADEKTRWQFKMKQYADNITAERERVRLAEEKGMRDDIYREKQSSRNFELDKINSNNSREIAAEYARNQPKTVTYNNIFWR